MIGCHPLRLRTDTTPSASEHLPNGGLPGQEIREEWLEGVARIGVTSGASTPETLVSAVVEALGARHTRTVTVAEEEISFVLPAELRQRTPA
ncbi:MAG: hypothetical protein IIB33_05930 [Chloroflexi bacterium]|nr:hypothetical protein [Chloroflexota bacterium]